MEFNDVKVSVQKINRCIYFLLIQVLQGSSRESLDEVTKACKKIVLGISQV